MQQQGLISIQQLLDRSLTSQAQIAKEADVDPGTASRAFRGKSVTRLTANKLLQALNKRLGTLYTLEQVSGLTYQQDRSEEDD